MRQPTSVQEGIEYLVARVAHLVPDRQDHVVDAPFEPAGNSAGLSDQPSANVQGSERECADCQRLNRDGEDKNCTGHNPVDEVLVWLRSNTIVEEPHQINDIVFRTVRQPEGGR